MSHVSPIRTRQWHGFLCLPCVVSQILLKAVVDASNYLANLVRDNWDVVKWIFCFLKDTPDTSICYDEENRELVDSMDETL